MAAENSQETIEEETAAQEPELASSAEPAAAYAKRLGKREIALAAVAAVAIVAAIGLFGLLAANSSLFGAAARYEGGSVSETEVTAWVEQYRGAYGLTDDEAFAQALASQNMTVASYRQNAIDQLVLAKLVEKRAKELGVSVSDEEVEARLASVYGQVAGEDNSMWQATLQTMGVSEDDLRVRYRADLLQEKVLSQDVPVEDATEEECLSYISGYLADTTQLHVMRIVFSSDEAKTTQAEDCLKELKELKSAGKLDADSFAQIALEYSEEEGVEQSRGELGWTGSGAIGVEAAEVIDGMEAGDLSELNTIDAEDNALEIFYISEEYSFPEAEAVSSLEALKVPDGLMSAVNTAAGQAAWKLDCNSYMAKMLANARITYYPVPKGASYDVDIQ